MFTIQLTNKLLPVYQVSLGMTNLLVPYRTLHLKAWSMKFNVLLKNWLEKKPSSIHLAARPMDLKPEIKTSSFSLVNWFRNDFLRGKIKINAFFLYGQLTGQLNYLDFFKLFDMPDTFNSWFLITELHVWMLMNRIRREGKNGKICCSSLIAAFWDDVMERSKVLAPSDATVRKKQLDELVGEFKATIFIYDEACLSDDMALASALWLRFFEKENVDPRRLEMLIKYFRHQIHYLETLSNDDIIVNASVKWLNVKSVVGELKVDV